jgi:hypothetical protein
MSRFFAVKVSRHAYRLQFDSVQSGRTSSKSTASKALLDVASLLALMFYPEDGGTASKTLEGILPD